MNTIEALRTISLYPINPATAERIAMECGLDPQTTVTKEVLQSGPYKKATAKVYQYLAEAPAVNEGGATYSFTDKERDAFRKKASDLLDEVGEETEDGNVIEVGWIDEEM